MIDEKTQAFLLFWPASFTNIKLIMSCTNYFQLVMDNKHLYIVTIIIYDTRKFQPNSTQPGSDII